MRIGLLDYGINPGPSEPHDFYGTLLLTVREAERQGYSRYWLAEHQAPCDSWGAQQLPLMWLAQQTASIALGSAGVLLDYHRPFEVACDFNLLEHLFPGRIDLGLARGRPHEPNIFALRQSDGNDFASRVEETLGYFTSDQAAEILPRPPRQPRVWTLGTSNSSMELALNYGLSYAHSLFHPFPNSTEALTTYTSRRTEDGHIAAIAVAGTCAATNAKAIDLAVNRANADIVPTIVGTLDVCAEKLGNLMEETGADELIFLDVATFHEDRMTSQALLSRLIS